jgi:RNA polymerase sigma factor (sigma-70 family)
VRSGDETAFTELYARHHAVARRVASTYRRGADADDLVNEAFEKVLGALRRGHGPTDTFRAYLFVTLRRLAAENASRPHDEPLDELPDPVIAVAAAAEATDPAEAEDRQMIVEAFGSLPERWQVVLWHTAVEGRKPSDLAPGLGMSPNAVSALAYRAREQLRQAYLQAHLQIVPRPQCEPHRSNLGAYVRDGLSRRERTATEAHLAGCATCQQLVGELTEVNQLLVRAFMPLFLAMPVQGIAASAAATASGGAAATSSLLNAADAASSAAPVGRRLIGGWGWARDVLHTAGGMAAATAVVAGLAASTLAFRHDRGGEHVDVAVEGETGADEITRAPAAGTSTPEEEATSAGTPASCTVTAAPSSADGASTPATPAAAAPATTTTTLAPGVDDLLTTLLGDGLPELEVAAGATTPAPAPGEAAAPAGASPVRLDAPVCTTSDDGRQALTVGVSNTADPADGAATTETTTVGSGTDTTDPAELDVSTNVLDTVTVNVELDNGVTAVAVDVPQTCDIGNSGTLVQCPLGTLLPGTGVNATLDLGLDGDGGGARVSVTSGELTLDAQALDLLPSVLPTTTTTR